MKIVEYSNDYREKTIQCLIDVAVKEFGFSDFEKWFRIFENEHYKLNRGNCWIAIDEKDDVIGTISLKNIDKDVAEVKNLYVYKEYRGNGISNELLNTLMEYASKNEYKKLQLDTYDEFVRAIKFYEKNGFSLKEKLDNKYIYIKNLL